MQNKILFSMGIYYLLTGLWPVIHLGSFLFVTGEKTDIWLVKTFSVILICLGITFCLAGSQHIKNFPVFLLALTSAVCLLYVDVFYSLSGVISFVYLGDAVIELILILLLFLSLHKNPSENI
jgi:hypothetical protein